MLKPNFVQCPRTRGDCCRAEATTGLPRPRLAHKTAQHSKRGPPRLIPLRLAESPPQTGAERRFSWPIANNSRTNGPADAPDNSPIARAAAAPVRQTTAANDAAAKPKRPCSQKLNGATTSHATNKADNSTVSRKTRVPRRNWRYQGRIFAVIACRSRCYPSGAVPATGSSASGSSSRPPSPTRRPRS